MRGFGFMSFGAPRRNEPVELVDPRPLPRYTAEEADSGDAALEGYTCLSRARPDEQGNPPPVPGTIGPVFQGPAMDFER